MRRESATLYKNGLLVLLVETDNLEACFMHCHNDFHALTGMASMVLEKPDKTKTALGNLPQNDKNTNRKLVLDRGFDSA